MIRQLALSAVLATGAFAGTASAAPPVVYGPAVPYGPPVAPAQFVRPLPPPRVPQHHHHYDVMVRRWLGWELRGSYDTRWEAERVANRLRDRGYSVRVVLH